MSKRPRRTSVPARPRAKTTTVVVFIPYSRNGPDWGTVVALEKTCPNGGRACLAWCRWLHARGRIPVGGHTGDFW
jgi:hypothetical protein